MILNKRRVAEPECAQRRSPVCCSAKPGKLKSQRVMWELDWDGGTQLRESLLYLLCVFDHRAVANVEDEPHGTTQPAKLKGELASHCFVAAFGRACSTGAGGGGNDVPPRHELYVRALVENPKQRLSADNWVLLRSSRSCRRAELTHLRRSHERPRLESNRSLFKGRGRRLLRVEPRVAHVLVLVLLLLLLTLDSVVGVVFVSVGNGTGRTDRKMARKNVVRRGTLGPALSFSISIFFIFH